jgi:hypothetical protein
MAGKFAAIDIKALRRFLGKKIPPRYPHVGAQGLRPWEEAKFFGIFVSRIDLSQWQHQGVESVATAA